MRKQNIQSETCKSTTHQIHTNIISTESEREMWDGKHRVADTERERDAPGGLYPHSPFDFFALKKYLTS